MRRAPAVSIKPVRICLLAARARGIAVDPAEFDIGPELADPFARVPHAVVARLWRELPERTGDAWFGLHTAELVQGLAFDVVDFATRSCATLGQSLATMVRYARLVHDAYDIRLDELGAIARYAVRFECKPPMPRQLLEFIMGAWVLRVRRGIDGVARIHELQLPYPAPAEPGEYTRVLGVPVRFDAECAAVLFERAMLAAPLVQFDPNLNAVLTRQAEAMLTEWATTEAREGSDLLPRVRRHIADALPHGNPAIGEIARRLGVSRRSLQRHLQERDASFAELVDATRREIALHLVAAADRTLCEVAFLSGFSDASAFTRAFRRWTGDTPSAHRQRVAQRT